MACLTGENMNNENELTAALAQSLKAAEENAIGAHERLAAYQYGEIIDISQHEGERIDIDITDINEFHEEASPANILALVEALEKAQKTIAFQQGEIKALLSSLESRTVKLPELCVGVVQGGHAVMVPYPAGHWFNKTAILEMLAAAGIKVEAE